MSLYDPTAADGNPYLQNREEQTQAFLGIQEEVRIQGLREGSRELGEGILASEVGSQVLLVETQELVEESLPAAVQKQLLA